MHKNRVEAFSDGVLAIVITIMVLELKVPKGDNLSSLLPLWPTFLGYILSFTYIAIYWNNHHHLFQIVKRVNGSILWANMHLLFWLSLIPFVSAWSGRSNFTALPAALYGLVLLMAAIAYHLLTYALLRIPADQVLLKKALGNNVKGKCSILLYALAIPVAFYSSLAAFLLYAVVAIMWIIPDRRIEKAFDV